MATLETEPLDTTDVDASEVNFFTDDRDSFQANQEGSKILKHVERNKQSLALIEGVEGSEGSEALTTLQQERQSLLTNLGQYRDYSAKRGEPMFPHQAEVTARGKRKNEEKMVGGIIKLFKSDEQTFAAEVAERGDNANWLIRKSLTGDDVKAKTAYLKTAAMKELGFSDGEIADGWAEPMARRMVGAGRIEPTGEAIMRWSLEKEASFERRHTVADAAIQSANEHFLSLFEEDATFEKLLSSRVNNLSDDERTYARGIHNQHAAALEEQVPGMREVVKKSFNLISAHEGTPTKFDGQSFANMDEVEEAILAFPPGKEDLFVAMLAATAKAHGQDTNATAGVMENFARVFERGLEDLGLGAFEWLKKDQMRARGDQAKFYSLLLGSQVDSSGQPISDEQQAKQNVDQKAAKRRIDLSQKLRNWRRSVAQVRSDNMWVDGMVYGTAASLPEMAAVMHPIGLGITAMSHAQRTSVELQTKHPTVDPEKFEAPAAIIGIGYAAIGRFQAQVLFSKMPMIKNHLSRYTLGTAGKLAIEVVTEIGQDGLTPAVMKAYELVDKEMPNVEFQEDVWNVVKTAPQMAFQMIPLVALSAGGSAAAEYMDAKQLKSLLSDPNYLAEYGLDAFEIAQIKGMPLMEAADYIKSRGMPTFTDNTGETQTFNFDKAKKLDDTGVKVNFDPGSKTYSVTNGDTTLEARSPEEVAEATRQLAPEQFKQESPDAQSRMEDLNFSTPFGFGNLFGEDPLRVSEALPPLETDPLTGKVHPMAKLRFNIQNVLLHGRKLPGRTLDKILEKHANQLRGLVSQFERYGATYNKQAARHGKSVAAPLRATHRAQLDINTKAAMGGDQVAMAKLPKDIRKTVKAFRSSQDSISEGLKPFVSKELAEVLGDNLGTYLRTEYELFDPKSDRNYWTIKSSEPKVFQNLLNYFTANFVADKKGGITRKNPKVKGRRPITQEEADGMARELLHPSRAQGIVDGTDTTGKVDGTSFFRKKQLDPAIVAALKPVVDPLAIMKSTGERSARDLVYFQSQAAQAAWMLENDVSSSRKNVKKGHTHLVGAETVQAAVIDPDTGKAKTVSVERVKKNMAGYGKTWTDPVLGQMIDDLHRSSNGLFDAGGFVEKVFTRATAVSKFALVMLNPGSYGTANLGGPMNEFFNGRMFSTDQKGAKSFAKMLQGMRKNDKVGKPFTLDEFAALQEMDTDTFLADGGVNSMTWQELTFILQSEGMLNAGVYGRDIGDTASLAFGENSAMALFQDALGKIYQFGDNASKFNALVYELDKWLNSKKTSTVGEALDLALKDVRRTTVIYDEVSRLVRWASQRGLFVPTFVSFSSELMRGTVNSAKLGAWEIAEGIKTNDKALRNAGTKRAAGMVAMGSMLYGLTYGISAAMTGTDEEERKILRKALAASWNQDTPLAYTHTDDGQLAFFDPSYITPYAPFFEAGKRILDGDVAGAGRAVSALFGDTNMMMQVGAEAITGVDGYGQALFNDERDSPRQKLKLRSEHVAKKMFSPGVLRTIDKWRKAREGKIGYRGMTAEIDDVALGFIGVRQQRFDTKSAGFLDDSIGGYTFRIRDSKRGLSIAKKKDMAAKIEAGELPLKDALEWEAELAREGEAIKTIESDFKNLLRSFEILGIEDDRLKEALGGTSVPKELRPTAKEFLKKLD
tara:strand:- start:3632 stop:8611 length:4980 start_codon:yes stop_codon:yes gene_type:complete